MRSNHKLFNLFSAVVLVANLAFPGAVTASAWGGETTRLPETSASLSALPDWFVSSGHSGLSQLQGTAADQRLSALPGWFTTSREKGLASARQPATSALPGWFAPKTNNQAKVAEPSEPASAVSPASAFKNSALPAWFTSQAPAGPANGLISKPAQAAIGSSILQVALSGSGTASLGSPIGAGERYTAIIRNTSQVSVAYGIFLTATHQAYFTYDGGDVLELTTISGTTSLTPIVTSDATAITWTIVPTLDLGLGDVLTLSFKLRAACNAESGQPMRVGIRYNADPALPPDELNDIGLNIITGRGNLVLSKSPAVQTVKGTQYGQPITWNVTVKNTGLGAIFDAYITDTGGISLSIPGGPLNPLNPSAYITRLEINESRTYTVVGTVNTCNFTNDAAATWICGNTNQAGLVVDAVPTNPVSSTAGILFQPQLPNIALQLSPDLAFTYCSQLTQTIVVSITNSGGPAGNFTLNSAGLGADLQIIPASVSAGWQYAGGSFAYQGGTPTGTIPALQSTPITLSFQVRPAANVCREKNGQLLTFYGRYQEVCSGVTYQSASRSLGYTLAQGEAPTVSIQKNVISSLRSGHIVRSGDVIQYQLVVVGVNPGNLSGTVFVSDTWSGGYQITTTTAMSVSDGSVNTTTAGLQWSFTPPAGLGGTPFTRTLTYTVEVVPIKGQCGATQYLGNTATVTADQKCPTCGVLTPTPATSYVVVVNNEGIAASDTWSGSSETCGLGFTFVNSYTISGSTVVTWSGAYYTDSMGIGLGYGSLSNGSTPLTLTGSISASIGGQPYVLTPTFNSLGQMTVDLSPLQAQGAPTQNLTLILTYTASFTEGILNGGYSQSFYDWSQLYLPNVSSQGCAGNDAYNQARYLTVNRGELRVRLSPSPVNQCQTTLVTLSLDDLVPTAHTSETVITFRTDLPSQILSTRDSYTYTGSLAPYSGTITVITDVVNGLITFTLPPGADVSGDGGIKFNLDTKCGQTPSWNASVSFVTQCNVKHSNLAALTPAYTSPNLGLFVTPIQYTIDKNTVIWWMLVSNQGNGLATNILVTNTLTNLAVATYTVSHPTAIVSVSGTLPISSGTPAVFTISQLQPNDSILIAVTGTVLACNPLRVDIAANLSCLGSSCSLRQGTVTYNQPGVYLLSDNSQTADLPMCDLGYVDFRTKNASPAATLYRVNITETLHGLAPAPGQPITLTIINVDGSVVSTTTSFTPVVSFTGITATSVFTANLVWNWDAFNANGFLDQLEPQATVVVTIPVILSCSSGTPTAELDATALGPCSTLETTHEKAFTFPTREPDIRLVKTVINPQGQDGGNVAVNPGDVITWHIRLWNENTGRSYPAKNVVLTDVWPANFEFITATGPITYVPYILTPTQFISWNINLLEVGTAYQKDFYIRGKVLGNACQDRTVNSTRLTYGCDTNGCVDGLAPMDYASLDSNPDLRLSIDPVPVQICGGDLTVNIRNYGAQAYTPTLAITIPAGYVYSEVVSYSSALSLTNIITSGSAPQFQWQNIPERISATGQDVYLPGDSQVTPSAYSLTIRLESSTASSTCDNANGRVISATMTYENQQICDTHATTSTSTSLGLDVVTPNLRITKTPHAQVTSAGETVSWTISLSNTGTGVANNVIVTDVAGAGYINLTVISDSLSLG